MNIMELMKGKSSCFKTDRRANTVFADVTALHERLSNDDAIRVVCQTAAIDEDIHASITEQLGEQIQEHAERRDALLFLRQASSEQFSNLKFLEEARNSSFGFSLLIFRYL